MKRTMDEELQLGKRDHCVRAAWLDALVAFVCSLLTMLAVSRALFFYGAYVQIAVVVGAVAGLVAANAVRAASFGALSVVVGGILVQPAALVGAPMARLAPVLGAVALGAGAVAAVIAWYARRSSGMRDVIAIAVLCLLVGNLILTTVRVDSMPAGPDGRSNAQHMMDVPQPGTTMEDTVFYRRVLYLMDRGTGYYAAFRQAYHENARWGDDPSSVVSYRMPAMFWLWAALPAKPWSLVAMWLMFAVSGLAATVWLSRHRVGLPFVIPAFSALCGYFLYLGTTKAILATESWAAPLAILCIAAVVTSARSSRYVMWTAVAVGFALVATLVRELMIYLLLFGFLASLFAPVDQRRSRLALWGAGVIAFFGAYALHAMQVVGTLSHTQGAGAFLHGGVAFVVDGFRWASPYAGGPLTLALFAVLAVVGAAFATERWERAMLLACAVAPVLGFLVVGNGATMEASGAPVNYWAPIVVPLLIALAPWSAARVCTGPRSVR